MVKKSLKLPFLARFCIWLKVISIAPQLMGMTFEQALERGYYNQVRNLICQGQNPNKPSIWLDSETSVPYSSTPLIEAAKRLRGVSFFESLYDQVGVTVSYGLDTQNMYDKNYVQTLSVLAMLKKVNIDAQASNTGDTALHIIFDSYKKQFKHYCRPTMMPFMRAMLLLRDYGASPTIANNQKKTVLGEAQYLLSLVRAHLAQKEFDYQHLGFVRKVCACDIRRSLQLLIMQHDDLTHLVESFKRPPLALQQKITVINN